MTTTPDNPTTAEQTHSCRLSVFDGSAAGAVHARGKTAPDDAEEIAHAASVSIPDRPRISPVRTTGSAGEAAGPTVQSDHRLSRRARRARPGPVDRPRRARADRGELRRRGCRSAYFELPTWPRTRGPPLPLAGAERTDNPYEAAVLQKPLLGRVDVNVGIVQWAGDLRWNWTATACWTGSDTLPVVVR
jgi:hypothetical protein